MRVVIGFHDDLVALSEPVDPTEVVAVGAAVSGLTERIRSSAGGHVVVASPAWSAHVGRGALSEGIFIQSQVGTWMRRNTSPAPTSRVNSRRIVGARPGIALGGPVVLFEQAMVCSDLAGDLVSRQIELPRLRTGR